MELNQDGVPFIPVALFWMVAFCIFIAFCSGFSHAFRGKLLLQAKILLLVLGQAGDFFHSLSKTISLMAAVVLGQHT